MVLTLQQKIIFIFLFLGLYGNGDSDENEDDIFNDRVKKAVHMANKSKNALNTDNSKLSSSAEGRGSNVQHYRLFRSLTFERRLKGFTVVCN